MSFYIKKKKKFGFLKWMIFQLDLLNFGSLFTFAKKFLECPDFHTWNGTSRQYQILENFRSKFFFFRHFGHCGTNKHTLRNPQGFFRIFSSQFLMFEILWMFFFISSRLLRAYRFSTATARVSVRLKGWAPSEALQSYKSVQCRHPELIIEL